MTSTSLPAGPLPLVERLKALQLPPPEKRRAIRRAARASLGAVAQELNVDPMTVSRWERGLAIPRESHVLAYRQLLEALDALVRESDQHRRQK